MKFATGDRIKKNQASIEPKRSAAAHLKFSREEFLRAYMKDREMRVIPWSELWELIRSAKARGHTPMIESFYETLFNEARFDDKGAWAPKRKL